MPEMDGAEFLRQVREETPAVTRLLLTGHADINVAVRAVNDGRIFRFLTKPCPPENMTDALAAAVEIHRLLTAERVLLQKTLLGTVKAITNVLGLTNPMALGRTVRIHERIRRATESFAAEDRWHLEFAATCSQLAAASLPDEVMYKLYHGEALSDSDQETLIESIRAINRMLSDVPRLEPVTQTLEELTDLIGNHQGVDHEVARTKLDSRLLRAIIDLDALESGGRSFNQSLEILHQRATVYGDDVLSVLENLAPEGSDVSVTACAPARLVDGMVLAEDLKTTDGLLLLPRGFKLTRSSREHIVERFSTSLPGRVDVYLNPPTSKYA